MKNKKLRRTRAKGARVKQDPLTGRPVARKKHQDDNQAAIRRVLNSTALQKKIKVGEANDKFEKEADRVAEKVSANQPVPAISSASSAGGERKPKDEEVKTALREAKKDEEEVQKKSQDEEEEVQKKSQDEEEAVQAKLQRAAVTDEEELAQTKAETEVPEDELQTRLQRAEVNEKKEDEEPANAQLKQKNDEDEIQTQLKRTQKNEDEEAQTQLQSKKETEPEEEIQAQLQRKESDQEDEPLQTQLKPEEREEEQQARAKFNSSANARLMRKVAQLLQAKGTPEISEEAEQQIEKMRGQGDPLPEEVRLEMENKIGADFSAVRIHNNSRADELCQNINARAFTLGNDIFFASGEYAPTTEHGKNLLAHELTHVVQQQKAGQDQNAHRKIYRAPPAPANAPKETPEEKAKKKNATITGKKIEHSTIGVFDGDAKNILIHNISLPGQAVKKNAQPTAYKIPKGKVERKDKQIKDWDEGVKADALTRITAKLNKVEPLKVDPAKSVYVLKIGKKNRVLIGEKEKLLAEEWVTRPTWDSTGAAQLFEVDHLRELQLGGADDFSNLWLWEFATNGKSGRDIYININNQVKDVLTLARYIWKGDPLESSLPSSPLAAREEFTIEYDSVGKSFNAGSGENWDKNQIKSGVHYNHVQVLPPKLAKKEVEGTVKTHKLFSNPTGGIAQDIKIKDPNTAFTTSAKGWWGFGDASGRSTGIELNELTYDPLTRTGSLSGTFFKGAGKLEEQAFSDWTIAPIPGLEFAAGVNYRGNLGRLNWKAKGFSPLTLTSPDILPNVGLVANGKIKADLPILRGLDMGVAINGSQLQMNVTVPTEGLKLPKPFKVTHSSVRAFAEPKGFGADGSAGIAIDKVGEGEITVGMSSARGFYAAGSFNFDSKIFTQAEISAKYENGDFSAAGKLAIAKGKIKGIDSAALDVAVDKNKFEATGTVKPAMPAVEDASLHVKYEEGKELVIGGKLNLKAGTPGIKSGSIEAEVKKLGDDYKVKAKGTATPNIPGINSELTVEYDDGAFTAEVKASYSKGMLAGQITAGVTNRTVDENGQLGGAAEDDALRMYGGGQLDLKLAPWLKASAGVNISATGQVLVKGKIGLPASIELFARKEFNKSLFSVSAQAPIVPGVVAEIGGNLSATAGIGPGVIDKLELSVEYNPDDESATKVSGGAHLKIPADAGLRLGVRAGIGLGITGASATGGIEIGGTLGVEGAAEAGVNVDWSPQKGLEINSKVGISAQPSFTFDISGYVSVKALGFSVYDDRFKFASYKFGSDYTFGIALPIHYKEGEAFNVSLSDIEFKVPDIDTSSVLKKLISNIT